MEPAAASAIIGALATQFHAISCNMQASVIRCNNFLAKFHISHLFLLAPRELFTERTGKKPSGLLQASVRGHSRTVESERRLILAHVVTPQTRNELSHNETEASSLFATLCITSLVVVQWCIMPPPQSVQHERPHRPSTMSTSIRRAGEQLPPEPCQPPSSVEALTPTFVSGSRSSNG